MKMTDRLHSGAYTLLISVSKLELSQDPIIYGNLAKIHLDVIEYICRNLPNDYGVYSEVFSLYPPHAIEATEIVLQQMLTKSESAQLVNNISTGIRLTTNPLRFAAREVLEDIDDKPEFLQLRSVLRTSALPVVLSALDELMSRGVESSELYAAIELAYLYIDGLIDDSQNFTEDTLSDLTLITEAKNQFETQVEDYWQYGYLDGSLDTGMAKAGKMAGGMTGAVAGAKVGAIVGSVVPGFGTVVGAAVGGVAGQMIGKSVGEEIARPDLDDEKSKNRNDEVESLASDAAVYAKETFDEAQDISKALAQKASAFFAKW